jgi:hypothetical protein
MLFAKENSVKRRAGKNAGRGDQRLKQTSLTQIPVTLLRHPNRQC